MSDASCLPKRDAIVFALIVVEPRFSVPACVWEERARPFKEGDREREGVCVWVGGWRGLQRSSRGRMRRPPCLSLKAAANGSACDARSKTTS